jgi:thiamine biosynthesis lipoprotein
MFLQAAALGSLLLRLSLCPDCLPSAVPVERRLSVMGTVLTLSVSGPARPQALAASEEAVREITRVGDLLSTWKPGGPLDGLNHARPGEPVALPSEIWHLLRETFEFSERTGGAFDPAVLPLVRAFDLRGEGRLPDAARLSRARKATGRGCFALDPRGWRAIRLCEEAGLDEGAWGKGYALDRAAAALREAGVRKALLDLGGQVLALGPARVAVADPRDRSRAAASLAVVDASVSTSGNSERGRIVGGRRIGHLLDPRTGRPARDFGSVTVLAPSGLVADILSTAFFVLGPEQGLVLSEKLRREGFENRALFLIVREGKLGALPSPGLDVSLPEEGS